jgi:hypothetical protein
LQNFCAEPRPPREKREILQEDRKIDGSPRLRRAKIPGTAGGSASTIARLCSPFRSLDLPVRISGGSRHDSSARQQPEAIAQGGLATLVALAISWADVAFDGLAFGGLGLLFGLFDFGRLLLFGLFLGFDVAQGDFVAVPAIDAAVEVQIDPQAL